MMKKKAVTTFLKGLLQRAGISVHKALFRHMVRSGLVLCAVEPGEEGTEVVVDNQDVQTGEDTGTAAGDDQGEGTDNETDTGGDAEEVVVTIGEEAPPSDEDEQRAPEWVRELRKANREKDKRIRELEQKLQTSEPAEKAVKVGEKPTLEGCDFDADRFESELAAWHERKREAEQQEQKKREAAEAERKSWQAKLDNYGKAKTELKVKDFEDAEDVLKETLNPTQQGVIIHGADNPALLVYALGKNPKKAKELAAINDPVKFAFAVAKLETQLKVTPRKAAPAPEKTVRGSAPVSGTMDKTLERLEEEAVRTGDRSKIVAYRRQMKQSAA